MPEHGRYLWNWFWTLSNRRRSGPEALSYAEVGEWQRITRAPIRAAEVEVLLQMDDSYLAETRKEQDAERARAAQQTPRT